MVRHVWLSFPLGLDDPRPPAIPAPQLDTLYSIADHGANVQVLRIASHTGTHVDAPLHVVERGLGIGDFSPEEFVFMAPVVLNLAVGDDNVVSSGQLVSWADLLRQADIALFRFGYGPIRREDPQRFSLHSPGFSTEAARWLRSQCPNLRAIGMDVPSLACIARLGETMAAHNVLLEGAGRRFLIIEDMDLEHDFAGLCEVRLSPWLVRGMDSGPCTVVGVLRS